MEKDFVMVAIWYKNNYRIKFYIHSFDEPTIIYEILKESWASKFSFRHTYVKIIDNDTVQILYSVIYSKQDNGKRILTELAERIYIV